MDFQDYGDLFNWNRKIMEDDWNDKQHLTIKAKTKANGNDFATTVKMGDTAKDGAYPLAVEQKLKVKAKEAGGHELEMKFKNSGAISYEYECNALKVS